MPNGTHKLNKCCLWSLLLLLVGAAQLAIKQTSRVVVVVVVVVVGEYPIIELCICMAMVLMVGNNRSHSRLSACRLI